jgi:BirA family transcriptional regulator, biotin operon repressor / biotin---[acetyl-CoA-carboxylase] ligase
MTESMPSRSMNSNFNDQPLEFIRDWTVLRLDEVDSTNSFIIREKRQLLHSKRVVVAKTQKKGRGRMGRNYVSLPGRHLTFSAVIHPGLPLSRLQGMALIVGIAVARVLKKRIKGVRLKWPNDVLVHNRKICGILIETVEVKQLTHPALIMGIGINTEGMIKEFPEELRTILTTLEEESKVRVDREKLFQEILLELDYVFESLKQEGMGSWIKEWMILADVSEKRVRCLNGNSEEGIFVNLTSEGFPMIRRDDGSLYIHYSGDMFLNS